MVQGNRMSMADPGARPPRKASQLVHGNGVGMGMADLEGQVVLARRVVQGNCVSMADLEGQVVLARRAHIKQGFPAVLLGKGAGGAGRRTARRTANSSREAIRLARGHG